MTVVDFTQVSAMYSEGVAIDAFYVRGERVWQINQTLPVFDHQTMIDNGSFDYGLDVYPSETIFEGLQPGYAYDFLVSGDKTGDNTTFTVYVDDVSVGVVGINELGVIVEIGAGLEDDIPSGAGYFSGGFNNVVASITGIIRIVASGPIVVDYVAICPSDLIG